MQQRRASSEPPEVMTWGRAWPVIIVAGLFDLLSVFFAFFWFLGPAIAGIYCNVKGNELVGSLWGFTATACIAIAAGTGAAFSGVTMSYGLIMADAVGFIGFLVLGLWIIRTNSRLFKDAATAPFWFIVAFLIKEIPFIGTLPSFLFVTRTLYKVQIHTERIALKKWKEENAATQLQEQHRETAQIIDFQAAREARLAQQKSQEAARDEIPENEKLAA